MNKIPDKKQIEHLLETSALSPTSRLDQRLSNAPWTPRAAARRRAFTVSAAAALIVAVTILATPQGRAFAQSIIRFFTPAQATSFPLPPPPGPAETGSPDSDKPNTLMLFSSLAEAESTAGFDAVEFAISPEGYLFRNIEANPALGLIVVHYDAIGGGGELILTQSLSGFESNAWGEVPPTAIEKVEIGGNEGEYAKGMFVVFPGADSATWEPDAPVFRLRW